MPPRNPDQSAAMHRYRQIPLILVLIASLLGTVRSKAQESPRALIDWLRVLSIETRLSYQFDDPPTTALFTETVPDGRSLMDYIADSIGTAAGGDPNAPAAANNWAILDEATSLCLAEAGKLRTLANANTGTPAEAKYNEGRKLFLQGAGRLLGFYKVAASDTFDENAGGLAASRPYRTSRTGFSRATSSSGKLRVPAG